MAAFKSRNQPVTQGTIDELVAALRSLREQDRVSYERVQQGLRAGLAGRRRRGGWLPGAGVTGAEVSVHVPEAPSPHQRSISVTSRFPPKRFLNTIILMPCQIVRGGRRLIYRLLSWNEWQGGFMRVVHAMQCRRGAGTKRGSGRPGPQGHREPRGRSGG